MNTRDTTAYCGIHCPDCILYRNQFSSCAAQLQEKLNEVAFEKYAAIETPFGADFTGYESFKTILKSLADAQCGQPCRVGKGCSGTPCAIMECCLAKGSAGCWECDTLDQCGKFAFLEPRCGQMPKNNARMIRKLGLEAWAESRDPLYVWQGE